MCDNINYSKFLISKLLIFVFINFEVLTAKLLFAKFSFRSYWRIPNKSEKYRNLKRQYTLCHVAVETMGPIDEESLKFLSAIGRHITAILQVLYSWVPFRRAPKLSAWTDLIHALHCTGCWRHHIPWSRLSSVRIRYAIVLCAVGIWDRHKSHRDWRMHTSCEAMVSGERPAPQRR